MFARSRCDVLVVGAGPVGLTAALALVRRGVRVEIVDRDWRTGAHSYALALHPASLALFDELGLGQRIRDEAYRVERVGLYDAHTRRGELRIGSAGGGDFLAVLPQDVLELVLEEALSNEGVEILWNHELSTVNAQESGTRVFAKIDRMAKDTVGYGVAHTEWVVAQSFEREVPFLIGADGHRSAVRRALSISFDEVGPAQHYAVFEFQSDAGLGPEMRLMLGAQATDVVWPLPNGNCRWSFELTDFSAPADSRIKDRLALQLGRARYPVLSEESLRVFLAQRAPWFKGQVGEIHWRLVVRFERRLAGSWGRGHVWLAGDAAHVTGPAGMQSMNAGLREATDLAEAIAGLVQGTGSAERLDDYGRRHAAQWQRLARGHLSPAAGAETWIAPYADRLFPCLPAAPDELPAVVEQLGLQIA